MSSHRRADLPSAPSPQHRAPRQPRLRKAVMGAAVIAALGGGTAFACIGGGSGHAPGQPTAATPTAAVGTHAAKPLSGPRLP
ncbi:hypothetical protein C8250_005270 [Streptomyces sp. So13.3]|uniref:hypothetical protein n=1 Tax=Streptomyces sp. So13.3 TaxID=2136173 RepID=UPI00164D45D9|nr:hypothetical protein [Streptomyces sp. So13.3]QNA71395.1 hypothetical protein C8250_005270 [Streptomyces sp. So13.3]